MNRRGFITGVCAAALAFGLTYSEKLEAARAHRELLFAGQSWRIPGSAFDIDFANARAAGTSFSNITTTRATPGYAQTATGVLVNFPSLVPRITSLGLLGEESRTNTQPFSQSMAGNWSILGGSLANNQAAAPDLTTTACLVTADGISPTNTYNYCQGSPTINVNQAQSIYVKVTNNNFCYLNYGTTANNFVTCVFDLTNPGAGSTQTVVGATSGTLNSAVVETLADGWFRIKIIATINSITTPYFEIGLAPAATGNTFDTFGQGIGAGMLLPAGRSLLIWGAQWEVDKAFHTSYIPTPTIATVTRNADLINLTGSARDIMLRASGTAFATCIISSNVAQSMEIFECSDATGTVGYGMRKPGANVYYEEINVASATVVRVQNVATAGVDRVAMAFQTGFTDGAVNGTLGTFITGAESTAYSMTGMDRVSLCSAPWYSGALNGYLQRFAFITSRVPNARLQALPA